MSTATLRPHTPWRRLVGLASALAAIVTLVTLAFLWPTVTAEAKDLPLAVAGPATATASFEQGLSQRAPGVFDVVRAADRAAVVDLIETRDVYGAVVLGASPEILTSTAGSSVVAQQLAALSPVLAEQIGVPVPVTDVVPLGSGDPRGAVLGLVTLPLVIGGMIGGILVSVLVVGVWRRATAVAAYSVFGGLAVAGVLQGWFGAIGGSYWVNAGIICLAIFGIAATIVGFVSVVGRPGIAIGPVVFLLIANPLAAAAQPWQMLPVPFGAIGQWMPPGAAAALLRDASYFPRADTTHLWLALASWAALGLVLSVVGHFKDTGAASRAALKEAEATSEHDAHHPHVAVGV
ncbi:hypothetical protein [Cellulomonas sp. URHE0023]|uniref:hypothetical protein n=1 Tax=Cellulomonas sp. URHE0023 TaxID=1380354 RepID=UPI0006892BC3|nr:hypothetical protein [Cellulomonas sp. URHE0023]